VVASTAALSGADQPGAALPGLGHRIGVLAVQGAFAAHRNVLRRLGAEVVEVRTPDQLAEIEAIVLPGGESTTISMMLQFNDLLEPLRRAVVDEGLPTLGTCAGMIVLAAEILDGRDDQRCLGAVDISVRRNAFGRQVDSFECELVVNGMGERPFPAVFIRAPVVAGVGPAVEVLAAIDGEPVLCRQGHVLVAAFHPELSGDDRLHRQLLDLLPLTTIAHAPGGERAENEVTPNHVRALQMGDHQAQEGRG
jgi:5'-phosphate synthase pdxT subunit